MADANDLPRRKWIPREAWRQEKAVVFARDCIVGPHKFLAHDRARNAGKEHLWQAKRGVRKGTPDTQLVIQRGRHIWFEFKSKGQRPDEDQRLMLNDLLDLGDMVDWGVTIDDMRQFYMACGVPLTADAEYRAMVLDGLVDSRIARAEGALPAKQKKRSAPRKSPPRFSATRGIVRRAAAKGVLI
jgi:hypothetical protein